jgi:hypothetical protein
MNRLNLPPAAAIGVLAAVGMIRTAAADIFIPPCRLNDAFCQAVVELQKEQAHNRERFERLQAEIENLRQVVEELRRERH